MAGRKVRGWTKRCRRRKSLGELSCLRLHFERFEKLGISQILILKKELYLPFFLEWQCGIWCHYLKRKKGLKSALFAGLMHDLCIMIFQQCTKWSSCLGCSLENDQSKTSFRSMYVRQWMCIRASKESLSCAADTILLATEENSWYFKLSSKTKGHQNRNSAYLHLLQEQHKDPRSTPL